MLDIRLASTVSLSLAIVLLGAPLSGQTVRIIQTNAAGDNVHIIDPTTNRVVDVIHGIEIPHGVTSHPDGSAYYFSNETDQTLDVVPTSTLRVANQIPLTGRPNNVAITPDGRKVYVAIAGGPRVDVVDLRAGRVVKSIPTAGGVHNVYVTPDGKHAVAGMIGARSLTVVDTETDEPVWSLQFDGGVRPMTFAKNPDGSTKTIFVQISGFHGVYVVDFAKRELVQKITMPELPVSRVVNDALQGSPGHGLAVAPDGSTLWSTSKPNGHVYAWSLPELEFLGGVGVGYDPDWLTMTPDGRYLYAANAGSNDVSVVDTRTMTEIARIPVGQVPKRNHTAVLPAGSGGSSSSQEALSFESYRAEIEPIFVRPRGGHGPGVSACVTCHVTSGTPLRLQPLQETADGGVFWDEAQSRMNFGFVSRLVSPGMPEESRLLRKPLAVAAGGARFHVGGKFWEDQSDPEWQTMAAWVGAADPVAAPASEASPAPLSFEFFRTCVQRIFLDKREDRMECVHCHGGGARGFARAIPEGRDYWNLEESQRNFEILRRYVEPGFPLMSRFLTHPLAPEAGGDHYHSGGRRWPSQADPEWQMLAAWVRGEGPQCLNY